MLRSARERASSAESTVLFIVAYVGSRPGAGISSISVYTGQKEVLFAPCTGLSLAKADGSAAPRTGEGAGQARVRVTPAAAR